MHCLNSESQPNESFSFYVNQGYREAVVLAKIGKRFLAEYVMPAGTSALIFLEPSETSGEEPKVINVSYKELPLKWIKAVKAAGLEFYGRPQQYYGPDLTVDFMLRWHEQKKIAKIPIDFESTVR